MAKTHKQNTRSRPVRHGFVVSILLLLPFLAIAGALAPGLVTVQYEEEEEITPSARVAYRPVRLAKPPLLVPRASSTSFIPDVMGLEQVFMGTQYSAKATDTLFKDALQPGVVADATVIWDPNLFDVIPNPTGPGGSNQYDDFAGQGSSGQVPPPIIPEPGTGSLVALGLLGLAWRARQRPPVTA
jgi:hypothetical protein